MGSSCLLRDSRDFSRGPLTEIGPDAVPARRLPLAIGLFNIKSPVFQFSLLFLATIAAPLSNPETIRSIEAVRQLAHQDAAKKLKTQIEGIVIFVYPKHSAIILHDGTSSSWVGFEAPLPADLKLGTRVRVSGQTHSEESYFANIVAAKAEILGQGPLPEPRFAVKEDLFSNWIDNQWIQIDALVVGTEEGGLAFTLVLDIGGRIFKADVPLQADAAKRAAALMQRKVRLSAIVGTVVNTNKQMTDRHFFIPSFDDIRPVGTGAPVDPPPLRTIATLLQSDHSPDDVSRIVGTVTQHQKGGFYLRDDTASTFVHAAGEAVYPPGSRVELEGFATVAPFRPILRASKVELIGPAEKLPPQRLDGDSGIRPELHNERVTTDCEFLAWREGVGETILQCRSGNTYFEAWLPGQERTARFFQPGDILNLTGVYEVTTTHPMPRIEWANGFRIHLAGPGDVLVVRGAPWWSLERLLIALGIAATVILATLVWTGLLRRRVAMQTRIISRQVEHAAIKDERQRIARELHDTLEQDLTGLSMQLENAIEEIGDGQNPARRSLDLVHRMLRHCRLEARSSVSDLRDPRLLVQPLHEAMKESLEEKARETGLALEFSVSGTPRALRSTTRNHFLRIAREALANSQRHAQPTRVVCRLIYSVDAVELEIEDDGTGFDPTCPPPAGHFGLTGMRERANKIHARFSVVSRPGAGTKIHVVLPHSSPGAAQGEPPLL